VKAASTWLGRTGVSASPPPEVVQVHPIAQADANGALLWVKTYPTGPERIRSVRARLVQQTESDYAEVYNSETTLFTPNQAELVYNAELQRYEVQHQNFPETGTWRVTYQAQDMDGVWSDMQVGEVQVSDVVAPPPPPGVRIQAGMNQSVYQIGDKLQFNLHTENGGSAAYDLYAALIFPDGNFYTFGYPLSMSFPNTITPYQSQLDLSTPQDHLILDAVLPKGLATGTYQGCGILTPADADPWDMAGWLSFHCQEFNLQ
ncbi:hypothetical protein, partial [Candidatus Venteria ishoeyi]|uniref:hypothetical protein n=1 Tax=Candidatus Venteria ishoeyi TaxID=1899563 RepID=UPI0015AFD05C